MNFAQVFSTSSIYKIRVAPLLIAGGFLASMLIMSLSPLKAFALTGAGTSGNPYQITSCADFKDIPDALDAYYILTQNINCSADGLGIMISGDPFGGSFNGQNHTITISIDSVGSMNVGLFSETDGASISNLTVAGNLEMLESEGDGGHAIGAVVGHAWMTDFDNITVTANISAEFEVGGIVGLAEYTEISNSSSTGTVTAVYDEVGGLIGGGAAVEISDSFSTGNITGDQDAGGIAGDLDEFEGDDSYLYNVYATGSVTAPDTAGGLVGYLESSYIEGSYATGGAVSGEEYIGGLVGYAENSEIAQSYATKNVNLTDQDGGGFIGYSEQTIVNESFATGDVTGSNSSDNVGGFVGFTAADTEIANSYARGDVTGKDYIGGFSGVHGSVFITNSYSTGDVTGTGEDVGGFNGATGEAAIVNSFWDTQTSGMNSSTGATGKTTAQMKNITTYTITDVDGEGPTAWDFVGSENEDEGDDDTWALGDENDGYPCLTWSGNCVEGTGGENETPDADNDGVTDATEDASPNNGDANNDGTKDSEQANVSSFVNSVSNNYVALALDDDCVITEAGTKAAAANATKDSGFSYTHGFVNFTADCGDLGYTTSVKVYQYGTGQNGLTIRKYFPASGAYSTISGATLSETMIGGKLVAVASYSITDGGTLDTDNQENGIIVDPVGLGATAVGTPNTGLGGHRQ